MASWIVHLRIAEKLLQVIPDLDAGQFAIGNVAPDSGIPDENWENFTPPSEITHFHPQDPSDLGSEDLRFFRRYLKDVPQEQDQKFSFLLGYFFHLITDNLWWLEVGQPTQEKHQAEFEADPRFIWEVKKDWYGLDFAHVRAHPEGIFWQVFLPAEYSEDYLDFFSSDAIPWQLAYIKTYYQRQDGDVEKKVRLEDNIYLTADEMDNFINRAAGILAEIYRKNWQDRAEVSDLTSALQLVGYL